MIGTRLLSLPWKHSSAGEEWPLLALDYDFRSAVWHYFERIFLLLLVGAVTFTPALLVWLVPLTLSFLGSVAAAIFPTRFIEHPLASRFFFVVLVILVVFARNSRRSL